MNVYNEVKKLITEDVARYGWTLTESGFIHTDGQLLDEAQMVGWWVATAGRPVVPVGFYTTMRAQGWEVTDLGEWQHEKTQRRTTQDEAFFHYGQTLNSPAPF